MAVAFAGSAAAQTFIQMSDPQFGMFTSNAGFAHETVNFEFAIASANHGWKREEQKTLRPVVTSTGWW